MPSEDLLNAKFVRELDKYHLSISCKCALLKKAIRLRYRNNQGGKKYGR